MISPRERRGRKSETDPGRGSAAWISNGTGPQDPGGGEAQLTSSRDVAVARPVFQPTSQTVFVRSDEVGVSAVAVDASQRRVNRTLSTVSDSMLVVAEELQRGRWTRAGSDLPKRGVSAVSVDSAVRLVGGPASAFLSGTDGCADFLGGGGGMSLWWRHQPFLLVMSLSE